MSSRAGILRAQKGLPTDAPAPGVIEVSIFGPGKGESIVAHVGGGRWFVVDSCITPSDKSIPPLDYLERIGVDIATQVDFIVATHAHDDHFAGISQIYERCHVSKLVIAPVATSEEFYALIRADQNLAFNVRQSAFAEYRKLNQIAQSRRGRSATKGGSPIRYAAPGLEIGSWKLDELVVSLTTLSPSDDATTKARELLAENAIRIHEARRLPTIDPNEMSIVLQLTCGPVSVLLGADLTRGANGLGWHAVLEMQKGDQPPASLFKVPHHGSVNADHEEVWRQLLTPSPVALLAPYRAGRRPLPSPRDRERILRHTNRAFVSASPDRVAQSRSVRQMASELSAVASNVRDPWGKSGQVRARSSMTEVDWSVELYWPAVQLT